MSTEGELTGIYPDWRTEGLTWAALGSSTQSDLDELKTLWFSGKPQLKMRLQYIWKRHPHRHVDSIGTRETDIEQEINKSRDDEPESDGVLALSTFYDTLSSHSPTVIASEHRDLYDPILFPCSSTTYIPNTRLRELRDSIYNGPLDPQSLATCEENLEIMLPSLLSWAYPKKGSETKLLDQYVNCSIINLVKQYCSSYSEWLISKTAEATFNPVMCSDVKTKYRLDSAMENKIFTLLTSECKGVDTSHFDCLIQALAVAVDSSIDLSRRTTLNYSNCSTPGVLVYADVVQFYGTYMLEDFPVVVLLTPPLTYTTVEGRRAIARGILACSGYLRTSIDLIKDASITDARKLILNCNDYFYKPIRAGYKVSEIQFSDMFNNSFSAVERMMHVYDKIFSVERSAEYIQFPKGLMRLSSEKTLAMFAPIHNRINKFFNNMYLQLTPIIVFPFLNESWKSTKPPSELIVSYCESLTTVVEILNAAKVAHMDLRPANIMWTVSPEGRFLMQVIDFEDAVIFGSRIKHIEALQRDRCKRYPLMNSADLQIAASYHNIWFLVSITEWLHDTTDHSFEDFMKYNHEKMITKCNEYMHN